MNFITEITLANNYSTVCSSTRCVYVIVRVTEKEQGGSSARGGVHSPLPEKNLGLNFPVKNAEFYAFYCEKLCIVWPKKQDRERFN